MEVRIIGGLLLGLAAAALGFRAAAVQEKKLRTYWYLRQNLALLHSAVERGVSLGEALESCTAGESGFWQRTADRLRKREGSGLAEIWRQELEKEGSSLGITGQEKEQFCSLGKVLGAQGRIQCCQQLQNFQDYLAGQELGKTQEFRQKIQLYRKLGLMTGALVIVLLI